MIEVDGIKWDKLDGEQKISYCESLLEDVKTTRQPNDMEWYINNQFEQGNHYIMYNTTTNKLEANPPKRKGEVRMVVNKIRSTKRAIQNYVVKNKPKWEVIPGDTDEETVKNARRISKVMDYLYRKLHLEQMVYGVIDTGLSTSVGVVEIDWDENAEGGIGQVRVRQHDPYDVWWDRGATLYAGRLVSRFVAKTPVRPLGAVKSDKRYDEKARKEVQPDEELAESSFKAKIIRKDIGGGSTKNAIPTVTVKEFLLWDDDSNSKGGHVKLFTYAGDKILREEDLSDKEYPIYIYQIQMNPLKIYQRAWISDAIPLNKAIDRLMSQKIMYINQAIVYRIIAEKGHGASTITNEQGEIVEINKGRQYQQMSMTPLPESISLTSGEANSYLEDTMGAHDAALGRMPAGARSGDTLEAIQAADSNNLTGLTDSLESFLSVVGEAILSKVSEKWQVSRIIKISEPEESEDGKNEYMKAIGSNAKQRPDGATVIDKDNELIVTIGSWLGHTLEAKRNTILKLAELGILPGEEVLRQFEFPNVEDLSSKAREQRLEQDKMQLAIAGHAGGGQGGGGNSQPVPSRMVDLADKESLAMMNGQELPPTEGADMQHTQAHIDFTKTGTFAQATPQIASVFKNHVNGELEMNGKMR